MAINFTEQAVVFSCAGEELLGIFTIPDRPKETGVLIVVGGPQYRAGSHRQFLLLSRGLAAEAYPTMRFDFRGMGDSSGDLRDFEAVEIDIGAALDTFYANFPQMKHVVLWGLCDAASASLLYWDKTRDPRVSGLVLLNPWIRSEETLARAHIKHYYGKRLMEVEFWRKLLTGNLGLCQAMGGFFRSLKKAHQANAPEARGEILSFQKKMLRGLKAFPGYVLLVLSGNDYTAKEFLEAVRADPEWAGTIRQSNVKQVVLPEADHTFSTVEWRGMVENMTKQWLGMEAGK
jgi:exosortase A-associated hydrolase 1